MDKSEWWLIWYRKQVHKQNLHWVNTILDASAEKTNRAARAVQADEKPYSISIYECAANNFNTKNAFASCV